MNSEEVSLIPAHPFIQRFVFSIIQNIRAKNFNYEDKITINADLVPRVSENVMKVSLNRAAIEVPKDKVPDIRIGVKRDMSELVAPIGGMRRRESILERPGLIVKPAPQQPVAPPITNVAPTTKPVTTTPTPGKVVMPPAIAPYDGAAVNIGEDYGKITPLLYDPSVSTIECEGEAKLIMVGRGGRRQVTRISLTKGEIKGILEKVADEAHIPLLEGVFRAVIKDFSINAVISETIGSRFVIKKATAYDLLK